MATNEFLPFAEGGNPNVESLETWQDDPARENGFTSGIAKSKPVNRILKQGACAAKAIADIIVDKTGKDALLNSESLQEGIEAVLAQYLPLTGGTVTGNITAPTFTGTASYATKAGTADSATTATSATSATKATQDSSGQTITSTYIKSASVSGTTVTFTRGNGTTFTITTQDTNTDTNTSCWTLSGGTNGWARDNSTGFCIQWGLVTLGARGDYSFTFPRAFSVVYSMSTIGGPQTNYRTNYTALTHLQALTNTGGTLLSASEDAVAILTNCRYIATGYV
jgi:hypothetical protein